MLIEYWDAERGGLLTEAALRHQLEVRGHRVTRYVYAPGTCSRLMRMSRQDRRGTFRAFPRGVVHAARTLADEPVVSLDAICIG